MLEQRILEYIMMYGSVMGLDVINEIDFNIKILDELDFFHETEKITEKDGSDKTILSGFPILWYETEDSYRIIIKDEIFVEGIDEKFGLECLFSVVTDIIGHYTEELKYRASLIDCFSKNAANGHAIWKEYYCAQAANVAAAGVYEQLGKEGYEIPVVKSKVLHLLKTIDDETIDKETRGSTLLYIMGKLASIDISRNNMFDMSTLIKCGNEAQKLYEFLMACNNRNFMGTYQYIRVSKMYAAILNAMVVGGEEKNEETSDMS